MFAKRLKELRKLRGLTQRQLADILFVDCSTVTKWETGKAYPDFEKQQKLVSILNVSLDYLMGVSNSSEQHILCKVLNALLKHETDYTDFARAVGVDVFTVFTWLRGISTTCYNKLPEISKYFNVSIDFLLGITTDPSIKIIPTSDEIKSYYDLDDIDRAEVRGEIKSMLKSDKYKKHDRIAFPESEDTTRSYTNIDFEDHKERIAAYGHIRDDDDIVF